MFWNKIFTESLCLCCVGLLVPRTIQRLLNCSPCHSCQVALLLSSLSLFFRCINTYWDSFSLKSEVTCNSTTEHIHLTDLTLLVLDLISKQI